METIATPETNFNVIEGDASVDCVRASEEVEYASAVFFLLFLLDGVETLDPKSLDLISVTSLDAVIMPPSSLWNANNMGRKY